MKITALEIRKSKELISIFKQFLVNMHIKLKLISSNISPILEWLSSRNSIINVGNNGKENLFFSVGRSQN